MKRSILLLVAANLIVFVTLLYMFDIFGVVNYYTLMRRRIMPALPSFLNRPKARIEDMYLLEKQDLSKMRQSFTERELDLNALSKELENKALALDSQAKSLEEEKNNLAIAWENHQKILEERKQYEVIITDLATKWGNMPPENSVAIIAEHSKNGEDQLIIDVFLEMDKISAASGTQSITAYLISRLDPAVAARILEKYEKRSIPAPTTVPSIPEDEADIIE